MNAIVMAAGEGRRLRPLTERWPKPVLPIDGRPVIATLLRELASAGCRSVTVVTGHLGEQVERMVGDGSAFGVVVRFARQRAVIGSADAVLRALEADARPPVVISAADMLYPRGEVARFTAEFGRSEAAGALAVTRGRGAGRVSVHDGKLVRVSDDDPESPWFASALWGLRDPLVPRLSRLSGPPFELAEAYQRAIDAGETIQAIEIGHTRHLTGPLDLVRENFPYLRTT
jgi:NDP-sugar pyrophosphorylase family protein